MSNNAGSLQTERFSREIADLFDTGIHAFMIRDTLCAPAARTAVTVVGGAGRG